MWKVPFLIAPFVSVCVRPPAILPISICAGWAEAGKAPAPSPSPSHRPSRRMESPRIGSISCPFRSGCAGNRRPSCKSEASQAHFARGRVKTRPICGESRCASFGPRRRKDRSGGARNCEVASLPGAPLAGSYSLAKDQRGARLVAARLPCDQNRPRSRRTQIARLNRKAGPTSASLCDVARLFVGVGVSPRVAQDLRWISSGIPQARWQNTQQFHITLQFLGEVQPGPAQRFSEALEEVDGPAFQTSLMGCGLFPHRGPVRTLWLGVEDPRPFSLLHRQVTQIGERCGLRVERRRYQPHLTLARFSRRPPQSLLDDWMENHFAYRSPPFMVNSIHLYRSVLSPSGARYCVEASFPLDQCEASSSRASVRAAAWSGLWPAPPAPELP